MASVKSRNIQYYVEGDIEKKLLDVLKARLGCIRPGKVDKLNAVTQKITDARLRTLSPGTMVVLVFDTDREDVEILKENIKRLKESPSVSEVVLIPQVPDLEAELVRSCDIKKIQELLNSRSRKDAKGDLTHVTNLDQKLREHRFDINRFWRGEPAWPYQDIENQAERVKLV